MCVKDCAQCEHAHAKHTKLHRPYINKLKKSPQNEMQAINKISQNPHKY